MANIDNFKAALKGGGARPNLFKVQMNFPLITGGKDELASFMIKGASLPPSTIGFIEVPYRGRKLKIAGDRTYEAWTITVINDTNMEIRNAFERWSALINGNSANVSAFTGNDALGYMTDIYVDQLNQADEVVKTYTLVGAWPQNIAAIELNYETNDSIEEFTVDLYYQYWTSPQSDAV
jgi:hypothetical protein